MADSNHFIPLSMEDSEGSGKLKNQPLLLEYPGNTEAHELGPKTREFLDKFTATTRYQVECLLKLQAEQRRLEKEYRDELQDLERGFFTKSKPLYENRAKIVGMNVPVHMRDYMKDSGLSVPGVPDFWLESMKNHFAISGLIEDYDLDALRYLTNIRLEYLERPERGFRLLFDFAENDFFTNRTLRKMYTYVVDDNAGLFYGKVRGDHILWKSRREIPPNSRGQSESLRRPNHILTANFII